MRLIYRRFHAARRHEVLPWLEDAGHGMVGPPPSAILLALTDDPDEVIWVGDRGADSDFMAVGEGAPHRPWSTEILAAAPARRLAFVDQWYRRPAPPHRVWVVEADAPAGWGPHLLHTLVPRTPREGGLAEIVGWTIYRALESPALHVGFVGVAGPQPARNPRAAEGPTWRPLLRIWRIAGPHPADRPQAGRPDGLTIEPPSRRGMPPRRGTGPRPRGVVDAKLSGTRMRDRGGVERSAVPGEA
jgi:hypothetical protein